MKKRTSFICRSSFRNIAGKIIGGVGILFAVAWGSSLTFAQEVEPSGHVSETTENYVIAVASDLHIDPENHYGGVVNPLVMYNMELLDALLWDVENQKADLLLLCGDITNAGRESQHEALLEKLRSAKEEGLPVYVLPGNHDIEYIEPEDFAQLYADFGYADAYSRDADSLSYSILLDDFLLLMLDTDGYTKRTNGAYLSEETLDWIRDQLELAEENHWQILSAGHYPLLTAQTTEFTNQQEAIALLEEYEVPLYLCGHLHNRHVSKGEVLTELVVEQVTANPCSYALLYKEENGYTYAPRRMDVTAWASLTGQTSPDLQNFADYEKDLIQKGSEEIVEALKKDRNLSLKNQSAAVAFFRTLQESYADGSLYEHLEELYAHPGYSIFMDLAKGTTYERWLPVILENAVPYTGGFKLKNQILTAASSWLTP